MISLGGGTYEVGQDFKTQTREDMGNSVPGNGRGTPYGHDGTFTKAEWYGH